MLSTAGLGARTSSGTVTPEASQAIPFNRAWASGDPVRAGQRYAQDAMHIPPPRHRRRGIANLSLRPDAMRILGSGPASPHHVNNDQSRLIRKERH
jgi:hypothetical protein